MWGSNETQNEPFDGSIVSPWWRQVQTCKDLLFKKLVENRSSERYYTNIYIYIYKKDNIHPIHGHFDSGNLCSKSSHFRVAQIFNMEWKSLKHVDSILNLSLSLIFGRCHESFFWNWNLTNYKKTALSNETAQFNQCNKHGGSFT